MSKKIKHDVWLNGYVNTFRTLSLTPEEAERKVKAFMKHPGPAHAERSPDQRLYLSAAPVEPHTARRVYIGPPQYKPIA